MEIYQTNGVLTDTIERANVAAAQAYLTEYDMTQFLDKQLADVIVHVEWHLHPDGRQWHVKAKAVRELDGDELKKLAGFVSGQNSDGLGEGFEQQDFAWSEDAREADCSDCSGTGAVSTDDDDDSGFDWTKDCESCGGSGYEEREDGHMISFDWETNDCKFEHVGRW